MTLGPVEPRGVTSAPGLDRSGLSRLHDRLAGLVDDGTVPAVAALVACGDDVHVEALGERTLGDGAPLRRDAIFRIASLTKPIAAAAAMTLVDDGSPRARTTRSTRWCPSWPTGACCAALESALDDTVPAERPITVEDLLTFRLGFGNIMAPPGTYPIQEAEAELGLCTLGPPWPPPPFGSDEWIARFATLPLLHQPGAGWRYNTGAQVLGIVLERASGQALEAVLRARVLRPPRHGGHVVQRPGGEGGPFHHRLHARRTRAGSPCSTPPRAAGGASRPRWRTQRACSCRPWTISGRSRPCCAPAAGTRASSCCRPARSTAMTRDHLTASQREEAAPFVGPGFGWGYGMAAPGPLSGEPPQPWGYGWTGRQRRGLVHRPRAAT